MESAKQTLYLTPLIYAGAACFFILFGVIVTAVHRIFFHPLGAFPGPKLAAITILYEAFYDVWKGGKYIFKVDELHQNYVKILKSPLIALSSHHAHLNVCLKLTLRSL